MKTWTLFLLLCCICGVGMAQDTIVMKAGDIIPAIVLNVTNDEVRFKRFDAPKGVTLAVYTSDVKSIHYSNGTVQMLNEVKIVETNSSGVNNEQRGRKDARENYKGKKSGAAAVGTTAMLLSPVIGVIPAIICSTTIPRDKNLKYPNKELMDNPDYRRGYRDEAHKIKQRVIWISFGAGSAIFIGLVLLT